MGKYLEDFDASDILSFKPDDAVLEAAYLLVDAIAEGKSTLTAYALIKHRVAAKVEDLENTTGTSAQDRDDRNGDDLRVQHKERG